MSNIAKEMLPMYVTVFKRYEKKYMLDAEKFDIVKNAVLEHMQPDEYGYSTICSIYFDTDNFDLARRSIEKPVYKEKLRLRCYGRSASGDDKVFIELKKKYDGVVYKRRVSMKCSEAEEYLLGGRDNGKSSQIGHEIDWFVNFYNPKPAAVVCYDRLAYFGVEDSSFRVTFDMNVRCRSDRLTLGEGDDGVRIIPEGSAVMEVKTAGAMPLWLCRLLSANKIYPTSFSKYGTYYKMTHSKPLRTDADSPAVQSTQI